MLDTPDEAMEYVKPFLPDDVPLARSALQSQWTTCPAWAVDGILYLLSEALEFDRKINILRKRSTHPWLEDTVEYQWPKHLFVPPHPN